MLKKNLLTIIITTKNRCETARESIALARRVGNELDVEVLVQDCSDDNSLSIILEDIGLLHRINYQHTHPVSMTENWNNAVRRANGEYLIIIGDDDAVLPTALTVAQWAKRNSIKAVKQQTFDNYWWSNVPSNRLASLFDYVLTHSGTSQESHCHLAWAQFFASGHIPNVFVGAYHNLVHHSVFDELLERTGKYFDSFNPDYYSCFAIGCLLNSYYTLDFPFTIVGKSLKSNSNRSFSESYFHFTEYTDYKIPSLFPNTLIQFSDESMRLGAFRVSIYHSYIVLIANLESLLKVRDYFRESNYFYSQEFLDYVNFPKLYSFAICLEPYQIFKHISQYESVRIVFNGKVIAWYAKLISNYLATFKILGTHVISSCELIIKTIIKRMFKGWYDKYKLRVTVSGSSERHDTCRCKTLTSAVELKMSTLNDLMIN
ncbi:glycosyltransferase [Spirulina major]|uniref:glycosyltransferase n=1 Tax=Spirulina major TaxID=270636 RepID=UPI000934E5ED|nr:glycosyltransferase [Spirulina major]